MGFADLVADADEVLGPVELVDGRQFAVFGYGDSAIGQGSIELVAANAEGGWETHHTVSTAGMPSSIDAPADLDGDGVPEIQADWLVGVNDNYSVLYRLDSEQMVLSEIPFVRTGLHEPMRDYTITVVEPGFVTTEVEDCEPSCADGGTYTVTWKYKPAKNRLVVASQPDPAPQAPPTDPLRIQPGVIDDGVHHGYLVSSTGSSFTFDKADLNADGSWTNVNPKLRTLPYSGSIPWSSGTPIEIVVQNQRVASVASTTPPAPVDPLRIPPGVIEDGVHYGYLMGSTSGSFTFDKADVLANGSWQNVNPKLRTLPFSQYIPWPSGTPIQVTVTSQRVTWVDAV